MDALSYKIKAATLMESIIAMIIIVMGLGVATMIYTNVLNSDRQTTQLKAMGVMNRLAEESKNEKAYLDAEQQEGDWTIKKTVNKYEQTENLYRLTFSVFDKSGNRVATRNELITIE